MDFEKELKKYISTIHYFAKRMYVESSVCDKDDLIQAGMIGMLDGLKHFNKDKAKQFKTKKSTYVIGCIRNAMLEEANRFFGPLRLPHRKRLRLNTFKRLLSAGHDKDFICEKMDMNDKEYEEMNKLALHGMKDTVSLPFDLEDVTADIPADIAYDIFSSFSLNDEEKRILDMRIFQQMSYSDIGKVFGVKRETMRKRYLAVLAKMREELKDKNE